jgi:chorismate synthase
LKKLERIVAIGGRDFLFRVETSSESGDYRKYENLRDAIWGVPEDHLGGSRNLACENYFHEGSSLFIGVFAGEAGAFPLDGEHCVGFSYGYAGVGDKEIGFRDAANVHFYSQFAGVKNDYRSFGLGLRIKEFQKEILLDSFGLDTVICTFDPLTGVNAHRNVHRLGMEVLEYKPDIYGEFGGNLNRKDVPSDRFLMSWNLKKDIRRSGGDIAALLDSGRSVIRAERRRILTEAGPLEIETVAAVDLSLGADVLLVRIPSDFYGLLRSTDVDDPGIRRIPLDWRMATREAFQSLFRRGYRVADFRKTETEPRENYYVLESRPGASIQNPTRKESS